MNSLRYGCIRTIAARTGHRCHLCYGSIDIALYGRTGVFGGEEATVDHLEPQCLGGDDEPGNLLIAHGRCNSIRGIRPIEKVRAKLAGTTCRPWSTGEQVAATVAVGGVAVGAGYLFREPETNKFNWAAAGIAGGAAILVIALA
jgi:hypothetical protein